MRGEGSDVAQSALRTSARACDARFGEYIYAGPARDSHAAALKGLQDALDAPQQEAVAEVTNSGTGAVLYRDAHVEDGDLLYLHPAPSVPDGWQLVPKEPTPEMLKSAVMERHGTATYRCVSTKGVAVLEEEALDDYKAMLSAAPKAPTTDDRKDAERYKWLRDIGDRTWEPMAKRVLEGAKGIDAAIDAAIAAQKGEKE